MSTRILPHPATGIIWEHIVAEETGQDRGDDRAYEVLELQRERPWHRQQRGGAGRENLSVDIPQCVDNRRVECDGFIGCASQPDERQRGKRNEPRIQFVDFQ
jgi:hypothetical protein